MLGIGDHDAYALQRVPRGLQETQPAFDNRNGVPVAIGGTTSNPTFTPNMSGILNSATTGNPKKGAAKPSPNSDPLSNALDGLFRPH